MSLRVPLPVRVQHLLRTTVEDDIFGEEEARGISLKSQRFSSLAERADLKSSQGLSAYLQWAAYLIAVKCLLHKRIETMKKNGTPLPNGRKLEREWVKTIYIIFKKARHGHRNDKKLDMTIADFLLRAGANNYFFSHLQICVSSNPRYIDMWLLGIDRHRQLGNFNEALTLAQKAYRFNPEDERLKKTISNLVLALSVVKHATDIKSDNSDHDEDDLDLHNQSSSANVSEAEF